MKILGYDYRLIKEATFEKIGAAGRLHSNLQEIQIASNLVPQQVASTVLHEIIEALNYHLQLDLNHNAIMSLEASLYQVLTDNGIDLEPLTRELE
jgi:hypothetical protein